MKKLLLAMTAAALLSASAYAADVKSYQVTGPVLELTDSSITVQKGSEKWQIAKGSATIPAGTKVGDKVTVQYTMTATSVTGKAAKK
jgi:opacity protein-like surface antigen